MMNNVKSTQFTVRPGKPNRPASRGEKLAKTNVTFSLLTSILLYYE